MKLYEIEQSENPFDDDTSDAFTDEGGDLKRRAIIYRIQKILDHEKHGSGDFDHLCTIIQDIHDTYGKDILDYTAQRAKDDLGGTRKAVLVAAIVIKDALHRMSLDQIIHLNYHWFS